MYHYLVVVVVGGGGGGSLYSSKLVRTTIGQVFIVCGGRNIMGW